jgi:hypothetical protein
MSRVSGCDGVTSMTMACRRVCVANEGVTSISLWWGVPGAIVSNACGVSSTFRLTTTWSMERQAKGQAGAARS